MKYLALGEWLHAPHQGILLTTCSALTMYASTARCTTARTNVAVKLMFTLARKFWNSRVLRTSQNFSPVLAILTFFWSVLLSVLLWFSRSIKILTNLKAQTGALQSNISASDKRIQRKAENKAKPLKKRGQFQVPGTQNHRPNQKAGTFLLRTNCKPQLQKTVDQLKTSQHTLSALTRPIYPFDWTPLLGL